MKLHEITEFKNLPKSEIKPLWKEAVKLFKQEEPKDFFKCSMPAGLGGGFGASVGLFLKDYYFGTSSYQGIIAFLLSTVIIAAIGGFFARKRLSGKIGPYIQRVKKQKQT